MGAADLAGARRRRGLRRAGLTALVIALIAGAVAVQRAATPASYLLRIPTQDASGITAGSDVAIAGVNAGTVREVSLTPAGEAVITAAIDPAFAPVHADATAQLRPKSLLGEMYVAIDPGVSGPVLASGATLPGLQVNRSTDLQQVLNAFDQPTRAKLATLIDTLGGGLAGRAGQLNQAIGPGSRDVADLAAITSALNTRDQQLKAVIATLNTVTAELAGSGRRQQLGLLIRSTQQLMANLQGQQARLQTAVVTADQALREVNQGLQGAGPALAGIAAALPATIQAGDNVLGPLNSGVTALLPSLNDLIQGIQWGPSVFSGSDANGYATRISLTVGCGSLSPCSLIPGSVGGGPGGSRSPSGTGAPASGQGQGAFGFLLGGTP